MSSLFKSNRNKKNSSTVTKKEYKINRKFNCNDKCLIYLLTCNECMLQYAGKSVDEFRLRWNNYKMNDRNFLKHQTCIQQHVFEHFESEVHSRFLEDVTITFTDKIDPKDPPNRWEHYWRHTLNTMAPLGLNVEDDQVVSAIF